MSRLAPKFAIGQVVTFNGEMAAYRRRIFGFQLGGWRIKQVKVAGIGEIKDRFWHDCGFWGYTIGNGNYSESCLRPIDPPANQSFDQLMQGLKRPQNAKISEGA